MPRGKWFGSLKASQAVTVSDSEATQPLAQRPIPVFSADAKKFGLENVRVLVPSKLSRH
jgi:hypothetical protein